MCETFSKPISFNDLAARADLNPPAQNKTISLFMSIFPLLKYGPSGSNQNSNIPRGIWFEFSILPVLSNSPFSLISIYKHLYEKKHHKKTIYKALKSFGL